MTHFYYVDKLNYIVTEENIMYNFHKCDNGKPSEIIIREKHTLRKRQLSKNDSYVHVFAARCKVQLYKLSARAVSLSPAFSSSSLDFI